MNCWNSLFLLTVVTLAEGITCPGSFHMRGHGSVSLINAKWNVPGQLAGTVEMLENHIIAPMIFGRTYFGDDCSSDAFDHNKYAAVMLLDRTLKYTIDVSGAGCGCNAALYLTSLRQNTEVSGCSDFYCDANNVCGVGCAEIDLQEANEHAWHSTLHVHDDGSGHGIGYGGGDSWNGHRDWTSTHYGLGAACIDTRSQFEVAVSFPTNAAGVLEAMVVRLSQAGKPCELERRVVSYGFNGRDGMSELTKALSLGMTPIISYWKSENMLWMDGRGADGKGPCQKDADYGKVCMAESVKFYNFSVEDYPSRRLQGDIVI